jgi:segregation and condensation protein B
MARGPLARRAGNELPRNQQRSAALRFGWQNDLEVIGQGELVREPRLAVLEAVLLAADEPLNARRLAGVIGVKDGNEVRRLIRNLQSLYDQDGTAFQVEELAGAFQLLTRPAYHTWLARLRRTGNDLRLSAAARETLAIVAYRQPIMRADVEAVRGVQCGEMLRQLMEKGLIRIAGRHDSLGRPVLYGTTRKFLQLFGLKSLKDLPLAEQLQAQLKPSSSEKQTERS